MAAEDASDKQLEAASSSGETGYSYSMLTGRRMPSKPNSPVAAEEGAVLKESATDEAKSAAEAQGKVAELEAAVAAAEAQATSWNERYHHQAELAAIQFQQCKSTKAELKATKPELAATQCQLIETQQEDAGAEERQLTAAEERQIAQEVELIDRDWYLGAEDRTRLLQELSSSACRAQFSSPDTASPPASATHAVSGRSEAVGELEGSKKLEAELAVTQSQLEHAQSQLQQVTQLI